MNAPATPWSHSSLRNFMKKPEPRLRRFAGLPLLTNDFGVPNGSKKPRRDSHVWAHRFRCRGLPPLRPLKWVIKLKVILSRIRQSWLKFRTSNQTRRIWNRVKNRKNPHPSSLQHKLPPRTSNRTPIIAADDAAGEVGADAT